MGCILHPTNDSFDEGGSAFAYLYKEKSEKKHYLFYSGSNNTTWDKASIGLATSDDGISFKKHSKNPLFTHGAETVTPNVIKTHGQYWMVFAYAEKKGSRKIGIASAKTLEGPWTFEKELIHPNSFWEGTGIDLGPSITPLTQDSFMIFYSNVKNTKLNRLLGPHYWHRQIGSMKITITPDKKINAERHNGNPLSNLNGAKGNWNESLFCPGYFTRREKHYLLPSTSTYSTPPPYKQYIGLLESQNNSFASTSYYDILINGPTEKSLILPNIKDEIALDTPSPLIKDDELWLYYAVMDRSDSIWRTALSIYDLQ